MYNNEAVVDRLRGSLLKLEPFPPNFRSLSRSGPLNHTDIQLCNNINESKYLSTAGAFNDDAFTHMYTYTTYLFTDFVLLCLTIRKTTDTKKKNKKSFLIRLCLWNFIIFLGVVCKIISKKFILLTLCIVLKAKLFAPILLYYSSFTLLLSFDLCDVYPNGRICVTKNRFKC